MRGSFCFLLMGSSILLGAGAFGSRVTSAHRSMWATDVCEHRKFADAVRQGLASSSGTGQRKALVTGGAGFIGSHVAEYCKTNLQMYTVVVDDLSGGFVQNMPPGIRFEKGDMGDPVFMHKVFQRHGPFDYVYHIGAYAAEGLSHFIRRFNYMNNLVASTTVLNEAILQRPMVRRFVFTSSIATYGEPRSGSELPMRETNTQRPEDPYGIAKLAFEKDLQAAQKMFGLKYTIFRPHNVYGPRQNVGDKFRNAIGIFMNQILAGEPITVFGDGSQTRAFSYIDDVAPYIASSVLLNRTENQDFFVGSDDFYSVKDLAQQVSAAMGTTVNIKHLKKRNEVSHAYAVHDKLRCFFNPVTAIKLREGLRQTALAVRRQGYEKPTGYRNIEIWQNMPPSWKTWLQEANQTGAQSQS